MRRTWILGVVTLVGCDGVQMEACTEIGCSSGLTLNVSDPNGNPASDLYGTITVDGEAFEFDCNTGDGDVFCGEGLVTLFIEDGTTAEYDIAAATGAFGFGELELNFEAYAPNGEDCDPICYNDQHDIMLEPPTTPE